MIVITGATGTIGSLVARGLRDRGFRVRAVVRDVARATDILGPGVELVTGDFEDAASLRRALAGADAVLVSSRNHPAQADHETTIINAATDARARRIVKLSTVGANIGSTAAFWDHHGRAERALWQCGVPAVCVRANFYMSNLLALAGGVRDQSCFFAPAAGARIAMIDPHDVAAVATHALVTLVENQTYEITGPEAITYDRVAAELTALTDRRITFIAVPDEAGYQAMVENGAPPWFARELVNMFALLRQGAAAEVTHTVHELLGREPRSLRDFLRENAALFQPQVDA